MKFNKNLIMAAAMASLTVGANAATVLYSENFDGEGPIGAFNDGTTPETNVGGIGVLQSSGFAQGNNAEDTAWLLSSPDIGNRGLRFGAGPGYNWAAGSNSATILTDGGFSLLFDYTIDGPANDWVSVRVGSGGENLYIFDSLVTFGALARGNGQIETFDNGAGQGFGTATTGAPHSARFDYAFTSWAAGSTVTFTGIIDGNTIATDTFTWDATDNMSIFFSGFLGGSTMDNIVVSTLIPEPSSALLGGLGMLVLLRRRRRA